MKKIVAFVVLLSLFNSTDTLCQAVVRTIKGQVIDEKKTPLIFANIALQDTTKVYKRQGNIKNGCYGYL